MSGIQPLDCSKLAQCPKNDNDVAIIQNDVFWLCFVSLVKFSYCCKFHVNIITGSGIMTVLFYNGLTRNLEIGNTPVWVLSNIWNWRELWIPNLAHMSLIERYWMLKSRVLQLLAFWVIKWKPIWVGGITPRNQIRVKEWLIKFLTNTWYKK